MLTGGTYWRYPGWPNPAWVTGNASALGTRYKLAEMTGPSIPPARLLPSGGLGHITVPSMSGLRGLRQATSDTTGTVTLPIVGTVSTTTAILLAVGAYFLLTGGK